MKLSSIKLTKISDKFWIMIAWFNWKGNHKRKEEVLGDDLQTNSTWDTGIQYLD